MVARSLWSRSETLESLAHGVKRRRDDARQREGVPRTLGTTAEALELSASGGRERWFPEPVRISPPCDPPAQMECVTAERGVQGSVVARAGAVSLPPALSGRAVVEGTRRGDGLIGRAR